MNKIRVCHAVVHSCPRVHKLAWVQAYQDKVTPYLMNETFAGSHPWIQYKMVTKIFRAGNNVIREQIEHAAEEMDRLVDLWHVHNEPDWLAPIIRKVSKKPLIFDVHDMQDRYERGADFMHSLKVADGILTCCPDYVIRLQRMMSKPIDMYHSAVPKGWYPPAHEKPRPGLVFIGTISTDYRKHCYMVPVFQALKDLGIPLLIMAADKGAAQEYRDLGFNAVNPCYIDDVLKTAAMYEAGIMGRSPEHPMLLDAMPNKLWEYLAAGIPTIAVNMPVAKTFLENHDFGVGISSVNDLDGAIKRAKGLRRAVTQRRTHHAMESQIEAVNRFYEVMLNKTRIKAPTIVPIRAIETPTEAPTSAA